MLAVSFGHNLKSRKRPVYRLISDTKGYAEVSGGTETGPGNRQNAFLLKFPNELNVISQETFGKKVKCPRRLIEFIPEPCKVIAQ